MGDLEVDILASGVWPRGFIDTVFDPAARRTTDARVESLIAEQWDRSVREATAQGKILFAGPQCRLVRHECFGDRLRLSLGPTDYRDFLGTNMQWPLIQQAVGEHARHQYSNPRIRGSVKDPIRSGGP